MSRIHVPDVKIYKAANTKSTLDVTSMLTGQGVYSKNKHEEDVYKGRMVFAISEHGKDYEKAYITKTKLKPVLHHIMNHTFAKFYGIGFNNAGFHVYGGSNSDNGVRSRKFSIFFTERNQFVFQIEEGPGKADNKGAIKMIKAERRVQKFISYEEGLEFAHEVTDFIRTVEMVSMINGKPLYTILPLYQSHNEQEQNNQEQYA